MINQYLDNIMLPYFYKYFMQLKKIKYLYIQLFQQYQKYTFTNAHLKTKKPTHVYYFSI